MDEHPKRKMLFPEESLTDRVWKLRANSTDTRPADVTNEDQTHNPITFVEEIEFGGSAEHAVMMMSKKFAHSVRSDSRLELICIIVSDWLREENMEIRLLWRKEQSIRHAQTLGTDPSKVQALG